MQKLYLHNSVGEESDTIILNSSTLGGGGGVLATSTLGRGPRPQFCCYAQMCSGHTFPGVELCDPSSMISHGFEHFVPVFPYNEKLNKLRLRWLSTVYSNRY